MVFYALITVLLDWCKIATNKSNYNHQEFSVLVYINKMCMNNVNQDNIQHVQDDKYNIIVFNT